MYLHVPFLSRPYRALPAASCSFRFAPLALGGHSRACGAQQRCAAYAASLPRARLRRCAGWPRALTRRIHQLHNNPPTPSVNNMMLDVLIILLLVIVGGIIATYTRQNGHP